MADPSTAKPQRRSLASSGAPQAFGGVPIEVVVAVGRARPMVADLVRLRRDSVLTLDTLLTDPVDLYVGDRLIARGELQELDDGSGRLAVRLTEVADVTDGD
ncbi:FliM/FliN family flagellar motor switch protein [Roseobacter sp. HKCCA0434]|uniref:FliM/FliN family flagellar motor switch protein n=1 Tax=Roseobacter sp. HKCCA0434 TaxID=3079297 RepID=UPI002905816B|nr:FliM/FliN family flagellar motor switch protein [Roseobacter sp. HKCCA0434]